MGAALLPPQRAPPNGPVGGEGGGLDGPLPQRERRRVARDRDPPLAVRAADGYAARPCRAARAVDGPARAALGQHFAHQGPRGRRRGGAALTKLSVLDAVAVR